MMDDGMVGGLDLRCLGDAGRGVLVDLVNCIVRLVLGSCTIFRVEYILTLSYHAGPCLRTRDAVVYL